MKKLLLNLTIVLCTAITAFAQNISFPDANFKAYLVGRTDSINTNKDTEISVQEALAFTGKIDLRNKSNIDLSGIEAFKNITFLRVGYSASKINVAQNTKLKYLDVSSTYNNLTALDVSNNTELEFLNIDSTRVDKLDVSKNLKLKKLWTEESSISSLNLSNNIQLEELILGGYNYSNPIDLSKNSKLKKLNVITGFSTLDLSKNINLEDLKIRDIKEIDLSKNLSLKKLDLYSSSLAKVDLSKNISLEELYITNAKLSYLNLKNNIALNKFEDYQSWVKRLICVSNFNSFTTNPNFQIGSNTKITETCPIQGNFSENPIDINNVGYSLYLNTLFRGRSGNTRCKTTANDNNTVEIYSTFNAKAVDTKIQIEVSNPNLETSLELIDTSSLYAIYTAQCLNYTTVGQKRIYTIPNLNIGQKYIFRLEIGGTSQLGYSRMETVANTVNVQLDPTVTSIESDELLNQNKTLQSIYNLQGIEVDKNYNGLVIYRYTDGTTQKVMQ